MLKRTLLIIILSAVGLLGFSSVQSLTTKPVFAQSASFVFTAGGDHGAPGQTDTKKSLQAILNSGAVFHVALGDMSYSDAGTEPTDGTTPSPWCSGTDPNKNIKLTIGDTFPFQMIPGNHEEDGGPDGRIGNFALCLPDRMGSIGSYGAEYYFDYPKTNPLMRVIMISAGLKVGGVTYDYNASGTRRTWLTSAIDNARTAGIPWVAVGMHKDCITMGNKPCEIGASLMNLLISKKVDLVLHGHDHDYQRSKQLAQSANCLSVPSGSYNADCVVDDGADGNYSKGAGTVFVISCMFGGGGFTPMACADAERFYFAKGMGGDGNTWNGISC